MLHICAKTTGDGRRLLCCAYKPVNTVHFQFLLLGLRVINKNISAENFITHTITIYNTV